MCKVSVIVPVYNVALYLEECLRSLLDQTLTDIEIICVNDGSTDTSGKILEKYRENDDRIVIMWQKNSGLSAARNRGLDIAKGKYVYFCDSDDYLRTDALECSYKLAEELELEVLRFGTCEFCHDKRATKYTDCLCFTHVLTGREALAVFWENDAYNPSIPLLFLKRSYIEAYKYRFIQGILHEDHSFFAEVFITAKCVYQIQEPFYFRRVHEGSITTTSHASESARGFMKTLEHFGNLDQETDVVRELFYFFFRQFMYYFLQTNAKEKKMLKEEIFHLKQCLKRMKYLNCFEIRFFCAVNMEIYLCYEKFMKAYFTLKHAVKKRRLLTLS